MAGALALVGCARPQARPQPVFPDQNGGTPAGGKEKPPAVLVTPAVANSGRVTSVNPASRFVVITYPLGVPLPAIERKLDVYRAGLKVAEVKITGPSRDLNTVADVTAGACQPGDEVRGN
jgi:hypothetical protein